MDRTILYLDKDEDGRISYEEFRQLVKKNSSLDSVTSSMAVEGIWRKDSFVRSYFELSIIITYAGKRERIYILNLSRCISLSPNDRPVPWSCNLFVFPHPDFATITCSHLPAKKRFFFSAAELWKICELYPLFPPPLFVKATKIQQPLLSLIWKKKRYELPPPTGKKRPKRWNKNRSAKNHWLYSISLI